MGDEHDRAWEIGEVVFEDVERGDVEIVGWLVEQEDVGGLQHQPCDVNARAFAAGEVADRQIELFLAKEEACGPAGDMLRAVAEHYGVAVGREGAAQRLVEIELIAVLIETRDAQAFGATDFAGIGFDFAGHEAEEAGFTGAIGAEDAHLHAGADGEIEIAEKFAPAELLPMPSQTMRRLVMRPVAVKSMVAAPP